MSTTHPVRALLTALVFAVLFTYSFTGIAQAQTCTRNSQCGTGKECFIPQGSQQGTCQTTPQNTTDTGNPGAASGETLVNPLKADSLEGLLDLVIAAAIRIGSIVLVLALVWVGFLFVAARGNEEKLRTARTAFFWTIIGGLILLGATGIKEVIMSTADTL